MPRLVYTHTKLIYAHTPLQVQALEAERAALAQRMQELVEENERLSKMGPNSSLVDLLYELPSDLQV
jgi:hypothetical protein